MNDNHTSEIERALASHTQDERVNALLDICVGRILKKAAKRGNDWTAQYKPESVDHIVEWLTMSCAEDAHWLDNTNPDGKPKKLLKFSTVQDAVREADEFFRKRTANAGKTAAELDSANEETVYSLDGGYRIVRMLSSTALVREGSLMGHCVGAGGYDEALQSKRNMFFSLRDPRNRPHVTMQVRVSDKVVQQAKGKQNAYPILKYAKMISAFAKNEGYDLTSEKVGLTELRTPDGDILDPEDLPEDRVVIAGHRNGWRYLALDNQGIDRWPRVVEVVGDATMDFLANDGPDEIIIHGRLRVGMIEAGTRLRKIHARTLSIEDSAITALPDDTTILENLFAAGSRLERLPAAFKLTGTLDIRKTKIKNLPAGISCGEFLASESALTAIPDELVVSGRMDIGKTRITALPEGFSCGDLLVAGSRLGALPDDLSVDGTIDLRDTDFTALPENLRCSRLDISGSKVVSLGRGTVVKGDLAASGSKLRLLPKGLHVAGTLNLSDSAVRVLPRDLFCGNLIISRTRVARLPASMTLWGSLIAVDAGLTSIGNHEEFETINISGCPIDRLPDHLLVHGKLNISRLGRPVSLEGFVGGNEIHANGTVITAFPDKLELEGGLYLKGATVAKLPTTLICSELQLDGAKLDELPTNLTVRKWLSAVGSSIRRINDLSGVAGIVDLTGTSLDELPDGLNVPGSLWIENSTLRHLPTGMMIADDLRAAGSKLESLGKDISIGRNADFSGTRITEELIWDARLVVKNVFDRKGGWVSGYEPMELPQTMSSRIARLLTRGVWMLKQIIRGRTLK